MTSPSIFSGRKSLSPAEYALLKKNISIRIIVMMSDGNIWYIFFGIFFNKFFFSFLIFFYQKYNCIFSFFFICMFWLVFMISFKNIVLIVLLD